jgi:hypothetical protein|tara:strand:+ start:93 stop:713 length:621 start_codon:yes stop_codon:yes gene_type:complete
MIKRDKNVIKSQMPKRQAIAISIIWFILLMSLHFLFMSCKKIDENGFRDYVIKEGNHSSRTSYKTTKTNCLQFQAIFDESAIYQSIDSNNQYDINKLYGLSDCKDHHIKTSIRLGWRWLNDSLELHWFQHVNNNFSFDRITTINLNTIVNFSITFDNNYYYVSVDNDTITIDRPCNNQSIRKYYLYPYFGGDEKAPHDIKIKIKSI